MEQTTETSIIQRDGAIPTAPAFPCPTCAGPLSSRARCYVYALGKIEPRIPSPGAEKEFAQAAGRAETKGKTDRETLPAVLSARENRYLARQLRYVFTVQDLETYIVTPHDSADGAKIMARCGYFA